MDAVQIHMTNTSNLPIETMEVEFPVRIERYELVPDSGGGGEFRGGLGVMRDIRVLGERCTVALRSARQKFPARGRNGGSAGTTGAFIRNPGMPDEATLPGTTSETPLKTGDVLRVISPGGGGFGDPRKRERRRVLHDVDEGHVSARMARDVYGVESGMRESGFRAED
jgi:N-methylhydantoinase B